MRVNEKKIIPYLIVMVTLVFALGAGYLMSTFYLQKITALFNASKEKSVSETLSAKKEKSELYSKGIISLFDNQANLIDANIEKELKSRIDAAYENARFIYEKYKDVKSESDVKERIVDALSHMKHEEHENVIFITDYKGNSILLGNQDMDKDNLVSYIDADYRSIVLEEIQRVRRRKEGFIKSTHALNQEKEIILVKDLDAYGWFIGSAITIKDERTQLKARLVDTLKSAPVDNDDFTLLFDENPEVYPLLKSNASLGDNELRIIKNALSPQSVWHENVINDYYYFSSYYEPLEWYFIHGFKSSIISAKEIQKQKDFEMILERETKFITTASILMASLVMTLAITLSLKISEIFKSCKIELEEQD